MLPWHASASRHSLRPPTTPSARQNSFATSSAGTVKHVAGVIWLWLEWDTKGKALEDSTGKVWLLDKVSVQRLFLCRSFVALRHSGGYAYSPVFHVGTLYTARVPAAVISKEQQDPYAF